MTEYEVITILSELFNGVKDSSLVNLTRAEQHEVEMWLENKLSEAAPKDFRPEHLKRMGVAISKGGEE